MGGDRECLVFVVIDAEEPEAREVSVEEDLSTLQGLHMSQWLDETCVGDHMLVGTVAGHVRRPRSDGMNESGRLLKVARWDMYPNRPPAIVRSQAALAKVVVREERTSVVRSERRRSD